ncbi:hypothetical protein RIF29_20057 [Crotalaria pallida]|uniref:Uncharacterized protein n=1 Tax=Crotalaria pallida TaxID=3830 RepID=A0AAN9I8A8_CROPI
MVVESNSHTVVKMIKRERSKNAFIPHVILQRIIIMLQRQQDVGIQHTFKEAKSTNALHCLPFAAENRYLSAPNCTNSVQIHKP